MKQQMRLMALPLLLMAAYGTTAIADQTPIFFATDSGTTNNLTLNANINVADADIGKNGHLYLGFNFDQVWYFNNGAGWVRFDGGALPVLAHVCHAKKTFIPINALHIKKNWSGTTLASFSLKRPFFSSLLEPG